MCFSASASFGAAAILLSVGAYGLSITRRKYLIPLAIIPLLFAAQQLIEGVIWLSLAHQDSCLFLTLKNIHLLPQKFLIERLSFLFLIFAYVLWPTWIPFAVYTAEYRTKRANLMYYLIGFGGFISGYLLYTLLVWGSTGEVAGNSIRYITDAGTPWWGVLGYATATIVPFFISSLPYAQLFGFLLAVACAVSYMTWYIAFASVWCFFAAVLSVVIVMTIKTHQART